MRMTRHDWYQGQSPNRAQRKAKHAAQPIGVTIRGHAPAPTTPRGQKRLARMLARKESHAS